MYFLKRFFNSAAVAGPSEIRKEFRFRLGAFKVIFCFCADTVGFGMEGYFRMILTLTGSCPLIMSSM